MKRKKGAQLSKQALTRVGRPSARAKTGRTHTERETPPQKSAQKSADEDGYKVGPGHPPREYRFKPGQSGNPKGRPRLAPVLPVDLKEALERAISRKATITEGDRQKVVALGDAGIQQLVNQFARGDRHARRDLIWLAELLGVNLVAGEPKLTAETLAPDRQAILDRFLARQTGEKEPLAAPSVIAPPDLLDDDVGSGS